MTERKGITRVAAEELLRIRDKLGSTPPQRGTHVGRGPHVKMPATWDGTGRVPPGWSGVDGVHEEEEQIVTQVDDGNGGTFPVVSMQKTGTYAVGLEPDTLTRISRDGSSRLTVEEKTFLEKEVAKVEAVPEREDQEILDEDQINIHR